MIRDLRRLARRLVRYASVSAIATATSLTVLGVLVATGATSPGWANLIATGVGTLPSFELNRRWVWEKTGPRSVWREVGPFCALSFLGLGLSTLAVSSASGWAANAGLGVGARTLVALGANVATFGSLWVGQYVVLDRVLFGTRSSSVAQVPEAVVPEAVVAGRFGTGVTSEDLPRAA